MKKVNNIGNYVFPQPTLIRVANHMVENMYRDQVEFAKHGITTQRFANIKGMITELAALPTDHVLAKDLYDLQQKTNTARTNLVQLLDELAITVELTFGKKSVEYAKFNFATAKHKRKSEFVFEQVEKVCTLISTDPAFAAIEFSATTIANIREMALKLHDLRIEAMNFGNYRKNTTVLRAEKAVLLYAEIAAMSSAGKRIWQSRNKVYYDNYVLSKSVRKYTAPTATAA